MGQRKLSREIRKCTEMIENEDTTYHNLRDAAKQCLEGTLQL